MRRVEEGADEGEGGGGEGRTDDADGVFVDEIAQHEAHDLERDACAAVFEHLRRAGERGGDVSTSTAVVSPLAGDKERTLRRARLEMWTVSALSFVGMSCPGCAGAPPPNWPIMARSCCASTAGWIV